MILRLRRKYIAYSKYVCSVGFLNIKVDFTSKSSILAVLIGMAELRLPDTHVCGSYLQRKWLIEALVLVWFGCIGMWMHFHERSDRCNGRYVYSSSGSLSNTTGIRSIVDALTYRQQHYGVMISH